MFHFMHQGSVEVGSTQVTLDDVWRLDLHRMEKWEPLVGDTKTELLDKLEQGDDEDDLMEEEEEGEEGEDELFDDDDDEEDDDDEDDYDDELVDEEDEEMAAAMKSLGGSNLAASGKSGGAPGGRARGGRAELQFLSDQLSLGDENRTPKGGEVGSQSPCALQCIHTHTHPQHLPSPCSRCVSSSCEQPITGSRGLQMTSAVK